MFFWSIQISIQTSTITILWFEMGFNNRWNRFFERFFSENSQHTAPNDVEVINLLRMTAQNIGLLLIKIKNNLWTYHCLHTIAEYWCFLTKNIPENIRFRPFLVVLFELSWPNSPILETTVQLPTPSWAEIITKCLLWKIDTR